MLSPPPCEPLSARVGSVARQSQAYSEVNMSSEAKAMRGKTEKSSDLNKESARKVREINARVIEIASVTTSKGQTVEIKKANAQPDSKADPKKSEIVQQDPFTSLIEQGKVIEPPFDMITLAMLCEHSSELNQCLEAMEVNISGTGYRLVKRMRKGSEDQ